MFSEELDPHLLALVSLDGVVLLPTSLHAPDAVFGLRQVEICGFLLPLVLFGPAHFAHSDPPFFPSETFGSSGCAIGSFWTAWLVEHSGGALGVRAAGISVWFSVGAWTSVEYPSP